MLARWSLTRWDLMLLISLRSLKSGNMFSTSAHRVILLIALTAFLVLLLTMLLAVVSLVIVLYCCTAS